MALRKIRKNARAKRIPVTKLGFIGMDCSKCGRFVDNVSADTKSVVCAYCVQKDILPPPATKKKSVVKMGKRGRPRKNPIQPPKESKGWGRGWHLKAKFIAPDGRVFIKGKLAIK